MSKTRWALEKIENENGQELDTLVRIRGALGKEDREEMGTVDEFVRLFEACQRRWSVHGWDIDKLITCVNECEFE